MADRNILRTVEAAAILLFLVQAVRVLFSVLFGVIYDAVFAGPMSMSMVVSVLLALLAFLTPLLAPRRRPCTVRPSSLGRRTKGPGHVRGIQLTLLITSLLVFLSRISLTLNNPGLRLYSSLLIVAGGGLYAAALLRERAVSFPRLFIAAWAGDQLFRAFGHTFDITLRDGWLPYQIVISVALAVLSVVAFYSEVFRRPPRQAEGAPQLRLGFPGGLAVGAFIFLETSLLAFPNAIARWSGVSYSVLTPSLLLITLLPLLPGIQALRRRLFLNCSEGIAKSPILAWIWRSRPSKIVSAVFTKRVWGLLLSLLTCLCLAVGYLLQGFVAGMALLLAQLLVLLALPGALLSVRRGKRERIGLNLALGLVFFLLINFAFAFAFTYAYTLEFFRGAGLPIVLVAGLLATLPAARRRPSPTEEPSA